MKYLRAAYLADGWLKFPQIKATNTATVVVDCGANGGLFSLWCISKCCDVPRRWLRSNRHHLAVRFCVATWAYTADGTGNNRKMKMHIVPCGLVAQGTVSDGAPETMDVFLYDPARPGETHRECYRDEAASQHHVMGYPGGTSSGNCNVVENSMTPPAEVDSHVSVGEHDGTLAFRVRTSTLSRVLWGRDGLWSPTKESCNGERRRVDC